MLSSSDINKLKFFSQIPIDKIQLDDGIAQYTVTAGSPPVPTSSTQTITNTVGTLVLPNGMFSLDNTNFYPCGARIEGAIDGGSAQRQWAECIITASSSTITFYMRSGYTNDQTFYIRYTLESIA